MADLFGIQQEIATRVAEALSVELLGEANAGPQGAGTDDLPAYRAYLEGRTRLGMSVGPGQLEEAVLHFGTATELDPDFAAAWAGAARARAVGHFLDRDRAWEGAARDALEQALRLAPEATSTRLAQAQVAYHLDRDHERAMGHLLAAVRDEPSNADAWTVIGAIQRRQGSWEEALASMERAFELDPRSYILAFSLGRTYGRVGEWARARSVLERAVAIAPEVWDAHEELLLVELKESADTAAAQAVLDAFDGPWTSSTASWAAALAGYRGERDDALRFLEEGAPDNLGARGVLHHVRGERERAAELGRSQAARAEAALAEVDPDDPWRNGAGAHAGAAMGWALVGDATRAREHMAQKQALESVEVDALNGIWGHWLEARMHAVLGDWDAALTSLETCLSYPAPARARSIALNPLFEPVRDDPRFAALLAAPDLRY